MSFEKFRPNSIKPETENSTKVDWSKHFVQPVSRNEIDPEHKLGKADLVKKINEDFEKRGIAGHALGSIDITEYPELVDEGIRGLCENINNSDFAKTVAGCEGHPIVVDLEKDVPSSQIGRKDGDFVYLDPYLNLLFDKSEKSAQVIQSLKGVTQTLREKYSNLSIEVSDEDQVDVRELCFNLNLRVPEEWMKERNKKLPAELDREIDEAKKSMEVVEYPREQDFMNKEEFNKAFADWSQEHEKTYRQWSNQYEFGLYWKEYGEYFDSPEARAIIKDFFDRTNEVFAGPSDKRSRWLAKEKEISEIPGLESGIIKTVTGFNMCGIPTTQSCEGHIYYTETESRITVPHIETCAPQQPRKRFVGQEEVIPVISQKYGVSVEDMEDMILNMSAFQWSELSSLPETPDYKIWREETKKFIPKITSFLDEFYQNREVPAHVKLVLDEIETGRLTINNVGGSQAWQAVEEKSLTESQKAELENQLLQYQKEMSDFALFLQSKYLGSE